MTVVFDFLNISIKTVLSLALRKYVVSMLTVQSILLPTLGLQLTAPTGIGSMWHNAPALHPEYLAIWPNAT